MLGNVAEAEIRMARGEFPGIVVNTPPGGIEEMPLPENVALASHLVEKLADKQRTTCEEVLYNTALNCLSVFLTHAPIMCITLPIGEPSSD